MVTGEGSPSPSLSAYPVKRGLEKPKITAEMDDGCWLWRYLVSVNSNDGVSPSTFEYFITTIGNKRSVISGLQAYDWIGDVRSGEFSNK